MHPYIRNLIALVLAMTSASMVTRSLAQTPVELDNKSTNNDISISLQSISTAQSPSDSSTTSKPVILSDKASNASSANNRNLRIPISSRIFSTPSMQQ